MKGQRRFPPPASNRMMREMDMGMDMVNHREMEMDMGTVYHTCTRR